MKALRRIADVMVALAAGAVAMALVCHQGARYARRLQADGLAFRGPQGAEDWPQEGAKK